MKTPIQSESLEKDIRELVLARLRSMPENTGISIGNDGEFSKAELIRHVEKKDIIGNKIITILIKVGLNEHILVGRIIYALACRSASVLGKISVKSGAIAYLGYKEDFVFYYSQSKRTRPLEDQTAKIFLNASNQIAISIIKRKTVFQAYNDSQKAFKKAITSVFISSAKSEDISYLPWLIWDMQHQVCIGNKNASII